MTTEQEFRELLTDKLIEVAEHPKMRKEFSVIYKTESVNDNLADDNKPSSTTQIFFYKNKPMMSNIEQHAVIIYLFLKRNEESFAKAESMIDDVEDEWDKATLKQALLNDKAKYFLRKGDEKAYLDTKDMFFASSPIFSGLGNVDIENLEEFYDYLVKYEMWEVVNDFAVNLFKVADIVRMLYDIPVLDSDYQLLEQKGLPQKELNFLRKVRKDYYVDKIIPEEFYNPRHEKEDDFPEEEEDGFCLALSLAISNAYGILPTRRRPSPKKGSFDYLYNKAEKGDKKAMTAIAEAYRTGNGTHANQRLADYWQKRAEH